MTNEAFIQILHVDGNHWIAVEHVSSDCVNIYDSVYSCVSTDTKIQIASLLHTGNQKITLKIHKVQFQDKASDCGVYSIAFATDFAYHVQQFRTSIDACTLKTHVTYLIFF